MAKECVAEIWTDLVYIPQKSWKFQLWDGDMISLKRPTLLSCCQYDP